MEAKEFNHCLQLIAKRDKQAMEVLYNNYYDKLLFSARLEDKLKADAEDIVSDVLISIFKNAANYSYIENPDAWMHGSLVFAIINFQKKNKKYVFTEFIDECFSAKAADSDFKIELKSAVEKLTKRQQDIFRFHILFDFEIKDTAKKFAISKSTVNREINKIKEKLAYLINFEKT